MTHTWTIDLTCIFWTIILSLGILLAFPRLYYLIWKIDVNYRERLAHFWCRRAGCLPPAERPYLSTMLGNPVCWGRQWLSMLWKMLSLDHTSVPHPNFTLCMAGGRPRQPASCCWGKGGEAHPLETAFLLLVLAVKSKHKYSEVKSAQLEGQPSSLAICRETHRPVAPSVRQKARRENWRRATMRLQGLPSLLSSFFVSFLSSEGTRMKETRGSHAAKCSGDHQANPSLDTWGVG